MDNVQIKIGGVSKQLNPTAVLDGQRTEPLFDDVGRQFITHTIRDLIFTATATLTTGTAATLLAGTSGFFADLRQISCANNSTASASITISDESTTVRALQIPAGNTLNITFDPPLKQNATGTNWNVDMEDITGTTISISAEFMREV